MALPPNPPMDARGPDVYAGRHPTALKAEGVQVVVYAPFRVTDRVTAIAEDGTLHETRITAAPRKGLMRFERG